MKTLTYLIFFVFTFKSAFCQISPAISCEFSKSLLNTGDSTKYYLETTADTFVPDREKNNDCALQLNMQPIYIKNIDSSIFSFGKEYSYSIWFKIKETGNQPQLFSTSSFFHTLRFNQGCLFGYGGIGGCKIINDFNYKSGQETIWHHLVLVSGDDSVKLYIDNSLHSKTLREEAKVSNQLILFKDFTGKVDNFKLFTYSLKEVEVSTLYNVKTECDQITGNKINTELKEQSFFNNGILYFKIDGFKEVTVYNFNGNKIYAGQTYEKELSLNLQSGVYIARVLINGNEKYLKIIK